MNKLRGKKGLSPVIATVLLILLVVVIATIVAVWFKSITKESVTKFNQNIEIVCQDVSFDASYRNGVLSLVNNEQTSIYDFLVLSQNLDSGATNSINLRDVSGEFAGLNSGESAEIAFDASGTSELRIIPVLLGETSSGETREEACAEELGLIVKVE